MKNSDKSATGIDGRSFSIFSDRVVIAVFFFALLVRLVYFLELSKTPGFYFPIIDAATYRDIAREVLSVGILDPRLFWQGFFYPIFLSGIFAVTGSSLAAARLIQVVLGSFTCSLVYVTAKGIFDRRTALLASGVAALYGPLVFFENELLATGWAAFWMIAMVYLLIRCEKGWGWRGFLLTGIAGGLAVLTRPTFLTAVVFPVVFICWKLRSTATGTGPKVARGVSIAGGLVAVLVGVAMLSYSANGHFSPFPRSGSLNLYIGNNPDRERTLMIRPGAEWKKLIREPRAHGYEDDAGYSKYFMERFRIYVATQPGSFGKGLFKKTLHLVSSRELPRNVDVYSGREDSGLMRTLVWKYGAFGFPFGIIFPLSIIGLVFRMRGRSVFLWSVPLIYSASLVLVFIASRYRTALVPVIAIASAAGAIHLVETLKRGTLRQKALVVALVAASVAISTLPGPFVVEKFDYTAEKYASIGYEMSRAGLFEQAETQIRRSIELQPRYAAGQRMLGNVLNQAGRSAEAEKHFMISLQEDPDSYMTHFYLSLALVRQDRHEEAEVHLGKARAGAIESKDEASLRQIERISAMIKRERNDD